MINLLSDIVCSGIVANKGFDSIVWSDAVVDSSCARLGSVINELTFESRIWGDGTA